MNNTTKLLTFLVACVCVIAGKDVPRIGIIGGGIGGSAAAYFLKELFGTSDLRIDVFEHNKIGGRLAIKNLKGYDYEVGGAIIHPRNKYMVEFVELFDLKRRDGGESSALGLYNGEEFVFSENSGQPWRNAMKLMWRYGYDILKLKYFIDNMLNHFSRIYTLQEKGVIFTTVEDILFNMNEEFVQYLNISAKIGFKDKGFSDKVINELILATLLVNYGQTTDVHTFVGAVSVAGATSGLWSVDGGNWKVAEKLLESANANIIIGEVAEVTYIDNGFKILYVDESATVKFETYDILILAAPVAENIRPQIKFINFPTTFAFPGRYHETICTIIKADINNSFFGFEKNEIQEILSINSSLFFNSIGKIYPVNSMKIPCDNCSAWKVFSQKPLKKEVLKKLFINVDEIKSIPWFAYPHYDTPLHSRKFVLHKNFYYVNAIEWAASAMEMSVIGAKNVALLAYKHWFNHTSKSSLKDSTKKNCDKTQYISNLFLFVNF